MQQQSREFGELLERLVARDKERDASAAAAMLTAMNNDREKSVILSAAVQLVARRAGAVEEKENDGALQSSSSRERGVEAVQNNKEPLRLPLPLPLPAATSIASVVDDGVQDFSVIEESESEPVMPNACFGIVDEDVSLRVSSKSEKVVPVLAVVSVAVAAAVASSVLAAPVVVVEIPTSAPLPTPRPVLSRSVKICFPFELNADLLACPPLEPPERNKADASVQLTVEVPEDINVDDLVFELRRAIADRANVPLARAALSLHGKVRYFNN